jgi:WD40 repeat protein
MGRFLITVLVAVGVFLGVAWMLGVFQESDVPGKDTKLTGTAAQRKQAQLGDFLYKGEVKDDPRYSPGPAADPIIIPSTFTVIDKVDIPSRGDGRLLFVGIIIPDGRPPSDKDMYAYTIKDGKPHRIRYRRLVEGDWVGPDDLDALVGPPTLPFGPLAIKDMVALVDPTIAWGQLAIKEAKVIAAKAEYKGAVALEEVYQGELDRLDKIIQTTGRRDSVSASEYAVARAQRDKYKEEAASKKEAISVAEFDQIEADTMVELLYLQNTIHLPGGARIPPHTLQIKAIYKNPGESVKNLDPVLQLQYIGRLRAEGLVDVQYLHALRKGMKVLVEPSRRREPLRTFRGHRSEITALAVSSDPTNPSIVSASEDRTVRVWKPNQRSEYKIWEHPSPVRAVACSPATATDPTGKRVNYCLTACADGSVRLWDLDSPPSTTEEPLWVAENQHGDAINCIAFSPDGKYYATGGEDNVISLWEFRGKEKPRLKYHLESDLAHQGAVTSLYFTPDSRLVSAGRDNRLLKWELRDKGAFLGPADEVDKRSGNITNLGVSPDGRYVLFDQGKSIQVMSRKTGRNIGNIQDPAESTPFDTFAVFSPDASLILTAGSSEGRLQLWRAPTVANGKPAARSYEVRQFIPKEVSQPTCAAFGKDTNLKTTSGKDTHEVFAVTGTKDGQIYLWAVPPAAQVDQRLLGTVTLIESSVDSAHQARIWVEVDNLDPERRLTTGEAVTIVVPRERK